MVGFHIYAALLAGAVGTAANEATKKLQTQIQQSQAEMQARIAAQQRDKTRIHRRTRAA
jgi:hypothetical protein